MRKDNFNAELVKWYESCDVQEHDFPLYALMRWISPEEIKEEWPSARKVRGDVRQG